MRTGVGFLTVLAYRLVLAVVTVDFDGELKSCGNGMELIGFDFSKFDILQMDDENITLNGKLTVNKDYNSPLSLRLYTKRLVGGSWVLSANRFVPNFCEVITSPNEMWTPFTSALEQQSCPFVAGHTENFDHKNIGNVVKNLNIPPTFLGQWQLFIELGTMRNWVSLQECSLAEFVVEEI